MNDRMNMNMTL